MTTTSSSASLDDPLGAGAPTVRLTTAEALVRWMIAQRSELLDGTEVPLFAGVFGIFGHGNVLGLGTALHDVQDELPTWRGQTEQGMALAAVAYAKAMDRRQVMAATSSVGPGRAQHGHRGGAGARQPAAGAAAAGRHVHLARPGPGAAAGGALRRPDRLGERRVPAGLAGTSTASPGPSSSWRRCRRSRACSPTPPTAGRWCWRCRRTSRRRSTTSRGRCSRRGCTGCRGRGRTSRSVADALEVLRASKRPLLVLGGGVRYSGAAAEALALAETHGVPVVETPAGRTLLAHDHPLHAGPLGDHRLGVGERAGGARRTSSSPSAPGCRTSPRRRGRRSRPACGS